MMDHRLGIQIKLTRGLLGVPVTGSANTMAHCLSHAADVTLITRNARYTLQSLDLLHTCHTDHICHTFHTLRARHTDHTVHTLRRDGDLSNTSPINFRALCVARQLT